VHKDWTLELAFCTRVGSKSKKTGVETKLEALLFTYLTLTIVKKTD